MKSKIQNFIKKLLIAEFRRLSFMILRAELTSGCKLFFRDRDFYFGREEKSRGKSLGSGFLF